LAIHSNFGNIVAANIECMKKVKFDWGKKTEKNFALIKKKIKQCSGFGTSIFQKTV
jgi:hypothetical protein